MSGRSQEGDPPASLEDIVAVRKQFPIVPSWERDEKAPQKHRDVGERRPDISGRVDAGLTRAHKSSSNDRDEKRQAPNIGDDATKKRKQSPPVTEPASKHRKEDEKHGKSVPSKRVHDHGKAPESNRSPKPKQSSASHHPASETKQETHKLVGAFVQTVEKVLTQFDGEKDRDLAFKKLQKEYLALLSVRQTEPEKLLAESNRVAKEAKAAHDDLNTKLRQQVANLTKKLDKYEKIRETLERAKKAASHGEKDSETVVALRHENAEVQAENETLRNHIHALELELKHAQAKVAIQHTPVDSKRTEAKVHDLSGKLAQSNKLLGIYELLTSMHISLKSFDNDKVEVSCRAMDSLDAKQFSFDVAIPNNPRLELDYTPSTEEVEYHRRQTQPTVPEYLLDELSFQRSELTRFMRTVLEAVIRKKS
ncbi:Aste57867_13991 [Aphanomyces stellatus]|uniref:Aste57867_13991 protein n=1 Tax=Aphanomyces stellatus TaxID=120398 RepID=A0A485KZK6_9STRA|nr:hypothetical protein As57867_013940 [Aphanomyces stellatus]VFT90821.1 Aste57867_13991 [Aphanomyces stellatus]